MVGELLEIKGARRSQFYDDPSPSDANGTGVSLNAWFGTAFDSWKLEYWDLAAFPRGSLPWKDDLSNPPPSEGGMGINGCNWTFFALSNALGVCCSGSPRRLLGYGVCQKLYGHALAVGAAGLLDEFPERGIDIKQIAFVDRQESPQRPDLIAVLEGLADDG